MDLQTLLDKAAITELRHTFAWALETAQPDLLADLFTEDAELDVGPYGQVHGREAIRRRYAASMLDAEAFTAMHAVTNPRIFVNGDMATGTWYLLDCVLGSNPSPLQVIGIYDETYRRIGGDWHISSLTLKFLWTAHNGRITADNPATRGGSMTPERQARIDAVLAELADG